MLCERPRRIRSEQRGGTRPRKGLNSERVASDLLGKGINAMLMDRGNCVRFTLNRTAMRAELSRFALESGSAMILAKPQLALSWLQAATSDPAAILFQAAYRTKFDVAAKKTCPLNVRANRFFSHHAENFALVVVEIQGSKRTGISRPGDVDVQGLLYPAGARRHDMHDIR